MSMRGLTAPSLIPTFELIHIFILSPGTQGSTFPVLPHRSKCLLTPKTVINIYDITIRHALISCLYPTDQHESTSKNHHWAGFFEWSQKILHVSPLRHFNPSINILLSCLHIYVRDWSIYALCPCLSFDYRFSCTLEGMYVLGQSVSLARLTSVACVCYA